MTARRLPNRVHKRSVTSGAPPRTHGCSWSASRTSRAWAGRTRRASARSSGTPSGSAQRAGQHDHGRRPTGRRSARSGVQRHPPPRNARGFRRCRWDRNAVYRATFTPADVSPVDHYHPSVAGQHLSPNSPPGPATGPTDLTLQLRRYAPDDDGDPWARWCRGMLIERAPGVGDCERGDDCEALHFAPTTWRTGTPTPGSLLNGHDREEGTE